VRLMELIRRRSVRRIALFGAVALVIVVQIANRRSPTTPLTSDPDFAEIDAFVRGEIADSRIPGMALAIVHDGAVVHVAGYGSTSQDGRAVTAQTPFVIGSVSKSFTSLAVMQLVDARKVDLDAPVRRYLPEFRIDDVSASERITVRHLLTHASGISTAAGTSGLAGPVTTLAAQVANLASVRPIAAPGASIAYSNANYLVLGRLIEVVSGLSYAEYMRTKVFVPLDMRHTTMSLEQAQSDGLSAAHQLYFGYPIERAPFFRPDFAPAGWIVSTAEDMGHYLVAQLNGASIVSAASLDAMHRGSVDYPGPAPQQYGFGWIEGPRNGVPSAVWHDGSSYDMHSMVEIVPDRGWAVALLTNGEALPYVLMQRTDLIADSIMARVLGLPPQGTLAGLYIGFDLLVIALILIQIRAIVRHFRRPPVVLSVRAIPALLFDGVLPLLALAFGWSALNASSPLAFALTDVGAFVDAFAILRLITLAARFVPRPRPPGLVLGHA